MPRLSPEAQAESDRQVGWTIAQWEAERMKSKGKRRKYLREMAKRLGMEVRESGFLRCV